MVHRLLLAFLLLLAPAVGWAQSWTSEAVHVFDVKVRGAKGDGITDDIVAFTAAITAAPSGGTVAVPPSTYAITSSIIINKSLTFQCEKGATIKFKDGIDIPDPGFPTHATPVLWVYNSAAAISKVVIRGCTLNGNRGNTTQAGESNPGIDIRSNGFAVDTVLVEDVYTKNTQGDGITVEAYPSLTVTPSNIKIVNSTFEDWKDNRQGIAAVQGTNIKILGNTFFNHPTGTGFCIDLEPNQSSSDILTDVEVADNSCYSATLGINLQVSGSSIIRQANIHNNYVDKSVGGKAIQSNAQRAIIHDNWYGNNLLINNGTLLSAGDLSADGAGTRLPQNYFLYSEQIDNAVWNEGSGDAVFTANYDIAPDGTSTADRVQTSTNSSVVRQQADFGAQTYGLPFNACIWARETTGGSAGNLRFRVSDGTNTLNAMGAVSADRTVALTTTWQHICVAGVGQATNTVIQLSMNEGAGAVVKDFLLWGGSVQNGLWPGRYVQTTNAVVTSGAAEEFFPYPIGIGDLGQRFLTGLGSPESAVAAVVGSAYLRKDGGANTTLYIKESGTNTTGWIAK
jgi:polygalacturonase